MARRKDKFSRVQRSRIMSKIRSKDTRLELAMKALLRRAGIRFQAHPKIHGHPDFLVGERIALFCDSSFWHGRNWKKLKAQLERGSNAPYWVAHIAKNRFRDRQVNATLRGAGFEVLRFWDVEVFRQQEVCMRKIRTAVALISREKQS